jgi:hypothetical protein
MPRGINSDFLQGYNFWAEAIGADGADFLAETDAPGASGAHAGFNNITIPEISADAVEYREGHRTWTSKQPGIPTVGTVSMQRGATLSTTAFYTWGMSVVEGREFRSDLTIYEFPRSAQGEEGIDDHDVLQRLPDALQGQRRQGRHQ